MCTGKDLREGVKSFSEWSEKKLSGGGSRGLKVSGREGEKTDFQGSGRGQKCFLNDPLAVPIYVFKVSFVYDKIKPQLNKKILANCESESFII